MSEKLTTSSETAADRRFTDTTPMPMQQEGVNNSRGSRGSWRKGSGKGRGKIRGATDAPPAPGNPEVQYEECPPKIDSAKIPPRAPRPTHFLALPLHTHESLRSRVGAFQEALFGTVSTQATHSNSNYIDQNGSGSTATLSGQVDTLTISESVETQFGTQKSQKKRKAVRTSSVVAGLDSSIVIDPRRLHMTLGVMALEPESHDSSQGNANRAPENVESTITQGQNAVPPPEGEADITIPSSPPQPPRKTVSTALALLRSLQPEISRILQGEKGVQVPLDVLDVLKTGRMGEGKGNVNGKGKERAYPVGDPIPSTKEMYGRAEDMSAEPATKESFGRSHVRAGVLFVGPGYGRQADETTKKLNAVCDLIHGVFKREGYIIDTRPLKLHCTFLNTSHRKPPRPRMLFSYTDVISSGACSMLGITTESSTSTTLVPEVPIPTSDSQCSQPNSSPVANPTLSPKAPDSAVVAPSALALPLNVAESPLKQQARSRKAQARSAEPLKTDLGSYAVSEIQLWVMGSHGQNNEYVSCGGVRLE